MRLIQSEFKNPYPIDETLFIDDALTKLAIERRSRHIMRCFLAKSVSQHPSPSEYFAATYGMKTIYTHSAIHVLLYSAMRVFMYCAIHAFVLFCLKLDKLLSLVSPRQ